MSAGSRAAVPIGLVLWMAAACVLYLLAPAPPEPPPPSAEELAAMQRSTDFVVRDTRAWQAEHGDQSIPWAQAEGHLAILIDDVGREMHVLEQLHSLRYPLSFAVLPGSVYAAGVQLRLRSDRRRYREILLHLPMQPLDGARMHEGDEARETFLLRTDDADTLRAKLLVALDAVPAAVGVNNHMGSALTTDRAAMDAVMQVLAERELFFIDSRTHHETVAETAARDAKVATASRHVFLDNEVSHEAIEARLLEAADLSTEQPVIAIGHPSVELYDVLRRSLPELHERKIGVYPVSRVLVGTNSE